MPGPGQGPGWPDGEAGNASPRAALSARMPLCPLEIAMRTAVALTLSAVALALAGCGATIEQKAATGAVAGAVVAGPVGAVVGGAAGAAAGQAAKDD